MTDDTLRAERGSVSVEFVYIGEGYSGDYDSNDLDDRPLYRIDVFNETGVDLDLEDGDSESFCSHIEMDLIGVDYQALCEKAADFARAWVDEHGNTRGCAARLSWWTVDDQTSPFDKADKESA